jgi:hypothetical protein
MTTPKVYEGDREHWLKCIQANRKLLAHADWMDAEIMTAKALSIDYFFLSLFLHLVAYSSSF